jgi:hypothetical protein
LGGVVEDIGGELRGGGGRCGHGCVSRARSRAGIENATSSLRFGGVRSEVELASGALRW